MTPPITTASDVDKLAVAAAQQADQAIGGTRRVANEALDALQSGVDHLRDATPTAFGRAAAQVEELTRRGLERAREATAGVQDQVHRAGDRTVDYIRDEPVKAVLIAAATGAAVALLVGMLMRSHHARD